MNHELKSQQMRKLAPELDPLRIGTGKKLDLPLSERMLFQIHHLKRDTPLLKKTFGFLNVKIALQHVNLDVHASAWPSVSKSISTWFCPSSQRRSR